MTQAAGAVVGLADAPETAAIHDADRGVYGISVAAELVGMAAPSLRLYESHGLVDPERTAGGTRRYSVNDLERLRVIADLLEEGVNLTGIAMILRLRERTAELEERATELEHRIAELERGDGQPTEGRGTR